MATGNRRATLGFRLVLVLCSLAAFAGCKKEDTEDTHSTIVALAGVDVNNDGSISDAGLQKIKTNGGDAKSLTVAFVRTGISAAALDQLAKFPNLRHVEAVDSQLSQAAIDKLKAAIPEVQVDR